MRPPERQPRPRPDAPRRDGAPRSGADVRQEPTRTHSNDRMRGNDRVQSNDRMRSNGGIFEKIKSKMTPKMTVLAVVGVALLALVVCMLVNIIIGVRSIDVVGNDLAGAEEIAEVAGIFPGSGYFSYNTGKAEKNVLENIHCISEIKISRSVFGRVKITVTEKTPCWYMEVYGEYYVLSDSLEVIRRSDMRDDFVNRGLIRLDLPEVKSTVLGKTVEYSDGDRDCGYIPGFLSEIRETKLCREGRIDQVKLENKFKIFVVCDLKYKISLGKSENVVKKLDSASEVIAQIHDGDCYSINASDVSDISIYKDGTLDFSYLKPIFGNK